MLIQVLSLVVVAVGVLILAASNRLQNLTQNYIDDMPTQLQHMKGKHCIVYISLSVDLKFNSLKSLTHFNTTADSPLITILHQRPQLAGVCQTSVLL